VRGGRPRAAEPCHLMSGRTIRHGRDDRGGGMGQTVICGHEAREEKTIMMACARWQPNGSLSGVLGSGRSKRRAPPSSHDFQAAGKAPLPPAAPRPPPHLICPKLTGRTPARTQRLSPFPASSSSIRLWCFGPVVCGGRVLPLRWQAPDSGLRWKKIDRRWSL
jgi:hypothetical protein